MQADRWAGGVREPMRLACSPPQRSSGTQTPSQCRNWAATGTDKATDTLAMADGMRESVGASPARSCRALPDVLSRPVLPC